MYTLIATGKGSTFQILKLEDRISGSAKPTVILTPDLAKKTTPAKDQSKE